MSTPPAQQRASVIRALEKAWDGGPESVLSVLPGLMLRWPEAFGMSSVESTDGVTTYRRVSLGGSMGEG